MDLSIILDMISNFALSNPKLAGFCATAYMISLGSKIIREAVSKFVAESPSKEDDKKLAELELKPAYKAVAFVLDLLFRLKKL